MSLKEYILNITKQGQGFMWVHSLCENTYKQLSDVHFQSFLKRKRSFNNLSSRYLIQTRPDLRVFLKTNLVQFSFHKKVCNLFS